MGAAIEIDFHMRYVHLCTPLWAFAAFYFAFYFASYILYNNVKWDDIIIIQIADIFQKYFL